MSREADVTRKVMGILGSQLGIGEEELTPETRLRGDLAIDSVRQFQIVGSLEEAFDISIPINRLPRLETVADLSGLVCLLSGEAGETVTVSEEE